MPKLLFPFIFQASHFSYFQVLDFLEGSCQFSHLWVWVIDVWSLFIVLFHPFSVRSLEEDDGLFQGHIKLLFRYRVLDNLQGRFVDILRKHLVSTLERIDGINQIDIQLVDIDHTICQLDKAIAF